MKFMVLSLLLAATTTSNVEVKNAATVRDNVALCRRSQCQWCGLFAYDDRGQVLYQASACETRFQIQEEDARRKQEDADIRAKYLHSIQR
jgi:hypothetical protein